MARRSIAKTAIEGGRHGTCRSAEDEADRRERRAWRDYCRRASYDFDVEDPAGVSFAAPYETGRQYREFDDKLKPVKRWLESQVGRPWDHIKSDVVALFDNRTTAGRHIIEHVKCFVSLPTDQHRYNPYPPYPGKLYVDEHGVLRQAPWMSRKKWYASR